MSVGTLTEGRYTCLYDSVTMTAFGPIFYDDENVEAFLKWLPKDARVYSDKDLADAVYAWRISQTQKQPEEKQ